jgi:hypothetical protein
MGWMCKRKTSQRRVIQWCCSAFIYFFFLCTTLISLQIEVATALCRADHPCNASTYESETDAWIFPFVDVFQGDGAATGTSSTVLQTPAASFTLSDTNDEAAVLFSSIFVSLLCHGSTSQ